MSYATLQKLFPQSTLPKPVRKSIFIKKIDGEVFQSNILEKTLEKKLISWLIYYNKRLNSGTLKQIQEAMDYLIFCNDELSLFADITRILNKINVERPRIDLVDSEGKKFDFKKYLEYLKKNYEEVSCGVERNFQDLPLDCRSYEITKTEKDDQFHRSYQVIMESFVKKTFPPRVPLIIIKNTRKDEDRFAQFIRDEAERLRVDRLKQAYEKLKKLVEDYPPKSKIEQSSCSVKHP